MQPIIIQINKPIKDLHAMEHDINTRFPVFQFKDGMKSIDLTSHTVRVYGKNQRLNTFFNDLEIINAKQGIAKLELTDTMMIEGTTQMQFVIMPNSGGQLKSHIFNLINGKSLVDSDAIEGSNEYKTFESALSKIDGYNARLEVVEETSIANSQEITTLQESLQQANSTISQLQESLSQANSTIEILNSFKDSFTVGGTENKGYEEFKLSDGKVWVHEYGIYNTSSGGGVKVDRIEDIKAISATCQATTAQSVAVNKENTDTIRFYHSYSSGSLNIRWHAWGYKKGGLI